MASSDYQCGAQTGAGHSCTRSVDGPDEFCHQHGPGETSPGGRPEHEPTEVTAAVVEALGMCGHSNEVIAERIGIHRNTLTKHYGDILDNLELKANAQVQQTAFQMAASGENPSMTRYWLNCRSGDWNNKKNVDVTSDGDKVEGGGVNVVIHDNVVSVDDEDTDDES